MSLKSSFLTTWQKEMSSKEFTTALWFAPLYVLLSHRVFINPSNDPTTFSTIFSYFVLASALTLTLILKSIKKVAKFRSTDYHREGTELRSYVQKLEENIYPIFSGIIDHTSLVWSLTWVSHSQSLKNEMHGFLIPVCK